jgi:hypothetical protein
MPSGVAGVMLSIATPDGENDCFFKALYFALPIRREKKICVHAKRKGK